VCRGLPEAVFSGRNPGWVAARVPGARWKESARALSSRLPLWDGRRFSAGAARLPFCRCATTWHDLPPPTRHPHGRLPYTGEAYGTVPALNRGSHREPQRAHRRACPDVGLVRVQKKRVCLERVIACGGARRGASSAIPPHRNRHDRERRVWSTVGAPSYTQAIRRDNEFYVMREASHAITDKRPTRRVRYGRPRPRRCYRRQPGLAEAQAKHAPVRTSQLRVLTRPNTPTR